MPSEGFYVCGRYGQSIAWFVLYEDALKLAKWLNQRGGTVYTVERANKP